MNSLVDLYPTLSIASFGTTILLGCAGWVASIVAVCRSKKGKGLRILTILPPTYPLGFLALLIRDPKATVVALLLYLSGVLAIPVGGTLAALYEQRLLDSYESNLTAAGVSLNLPQHHPQPISDDENVWQHPFLIPIADAGQDDAAGERARALISRTNEASPYWPLQPPNPLASLRSDSSTDQDAFKPANPTNTTLKNVYSQAASLIAERDGIANDEEIPTDIFSQAAFLLNEPERIVPADKLPSTWHQVGEAIQEHYRSAESETRELEEALKRPNNVYPYQRDKDFFEMLGPHLSLVRAFSRTSHLRSAGAAMRGDVEECFRQLRLQLDLIDTEESERLVSALLKFALVELAIDSLRIIQQFHLGTDEDWKQVGAALDQYALTHSLSEVIRSERALAAITIRPSTKASLYEVLEEIDRWLRRNPRQYYGGRFGAAVRRLISMLLTPNVQAAVRMNWRQTLVAFEGMIKATEEAEALTETSPWNQRLTPKLDRPLRAYGPMATLFLAVYPKSFEKALNAQYAVETAKIAIALERYFIRHQRYPESLQTLSPTFLPTPPNDPTTGLPWKYRRIDEKGFGLYSPNQKGNHARQSDAAPSESDPVKWYISSTEPRIPYEKDPQQ